jgi:hypothetical protein
MFCKKILRQPYLFYNPGLEVLSMKCATRFVIFVIALMIALPCFSDDQQKAQKELNKITAMATDFTGRRAVNLTISEVVGVPRPKLVEERSLTGLNYGSLFLAEQLAKNGATIPEIADKLKSGKSIADVANERHVDWKQMAAEAKKLNAAVDKNLYKSFLNGKDSVAQDATDKYDVHYDGVKADADVSKDEIAAAQDRFLRWKDQAGKAQGSDRDKTLSTGDERVAYSDHVANSGPTMNGTAGRGSSGTGGTAGTTAPAGMGGPH